MPSRAADDADTIDRRRREIAREEGRPCDAGDHDWDFAQPLPRCKRCDMPKRE